MPTEVCKHGGYYEGEWDEGLMDGIGKLVNSFDFVVYEGQFKRDMFHGRGVLNNSQVEKEPFDGNTDFTKAGGKWVKYEGDFREDLRHGVGRLTFNNGDIFEGIFVKDVIEGRGEYRRINGTVVKGVWRKNNLFCE